MTARSTRQRSNTLVRTVDPRVTPEGLSNSRVLKEAVRNEVERTAGTEDHSSGRSASTHVCFAA